MGIAINLGGGGGGGAPSWDRNASNLFIQSKAGIVIIQWSDPPEADWKDTFLVRKIGGIPLNHKDGVQVVNNLVRDQFKVAGYQDEGLVEHVLAGYKLFPRNSQNAITNNVINSASITVTSYNSILEENSWSDIAGASAAGVASKAWKVGDTKSATLNGTSYVFRIIGFDHDNLHSSDAKYGTSYNAGKNKAGITFEMASCFNATYKLSNNTYYEGWSGCVMRTATMPLLKGYMPSELQAVLRTVGKLTARMSGDGTIVTTADQLFLCTALEILGNAKYVSSYSFPGEGFQYEYYLAGNTAIKTRNGSITDWILRSPDKMTGADAILISSRGEFSSASGAASVLKSISFGFCL